MKHFKKKKGTKKRSGFEDTISKQLSKSKVSFEYEKCQLGYYICKFYKPDFQVILQGNKSFFLETKGYFPSSDRTKMIAVKTQHPTLDIRLCFMKDNPIRKGSKTRYSDWAVQHGFKYCIGSIPSSWLKK